MLKRLWNLDNVDSCQLCYLLLIFLSLSSHCLATPEDAEPRIIPASDRVAAKVNAFQQDTEDITKHKERLYEIHLNGQNLKQTGLVLIHPDGRVWVNQKALARWHMNDANIADPVHQHDEEPYILLDNLGSVTYRINEATQSLHIEAKPQDLLPSFIDVYNSTREIPNTPAMGGFLNYDVSAQYLQGTEKFSGLFELGFFSDRGIFTTQLLNQDLSTHRHFVRLESTLTIDQPEQMASLRIGDSISRGSAWGRPIRFAGLQWSTNFSTQPNFITFPMPSISGSAALPSAAEVFVNNVRTFQHDIQAGPFSIRELPVITGQGEIRMVIRDLLGREQTISQPYYTARNILKQGLDDFSYEIGWARQHFSTKSARYGPLSLTGTRRHGVTDQLTTEIRGELGWRRQAFGLTGTVLAPRLGVFDLGLATSHSDKGMGGLLVLGFERLTRRLSLGFRTQLTTPQFDQQGLTSLTGAPSQQTTAHIGWNNPLYGSFGLGYIRQDNRNRADNALLSANYNKSLGRGWFLGLSAAKNLSNTQDHTFGLVFTYAFNERTTVNASSNWRNNSPSSTVLQVQQNLPIGNGMGYRVLAGAQDSERLEGRISMQNTYGTYSLEAARTNAAHAYRANARGGLALLDKQFFFARQLGDSFAVVRLPGYSGVQVYAENQPIGRTDASGSAFIPRLRPYQKNRISIEQMDLPLNAQIDTLELNAMPFFRSGHVIQFPIRKARDALLKIIMADGKPLPAGTSVRIAGHAETFTTAFDGQVYLSGLEPRNQIKITLSDTHTCEFEVIYPETDEPLPDLGSFQCDESVR